MHSTAQLCCVLSEQSGVEGFGTFACTVGPKKKTIEEKSVSRKKWLCDGQFYFSGARDALNAWKSHGKPQLGWTQADRSSDSVKEACYLRDRRFHVKSATPVVGRGWQCNEAGDQGLGGESSEPRRVGRRTYSEAPCTRSVATSRRAHGKHRDKRAPRSLALRRCGRQLQLGGAKRRGAGDYEPRSSDYDDGADDMTE
eukprot:COSAG01_NODE_6074_length_3867_cov_5.623938_3_plen_198_part_00